MQIQDLVSLSLITNIPLPTIGRSIGDDTPPVFRGAPRKTGGVSSPILLPMVGRGMLVIKLRETRSWICISRG